MNPSEENLLEGRPLGAGGPKGSGNGPSIDRLSQLIEEEKNAYAKDLCNASPDINDLSYRFVSGLFARIEQSLRTKDPITDSNFEEAHRHAIMIEGATLYREVGRDVLGPLVVRFVENVLIDAPAGATIAFLARDAEPYFEAAAVLNQLPGFTEKQLDLRYVTLNRQHFQIFDENLDREQSVTIDPQQEALRDLYLKQQNFANPNGVVIVDTGCWGTMIEKLWGAMAKRGPGVLNLCQAHFMYSHNPAIFGFVNHVANAGDMHQLAAYGVFVGDTFECLPKRDESSSKFMRRADGVVEPIRVPIDSMYLASWNKGVLAGIRAAARSYGDQQASFVTAVEALRIVEEQRIKAELEFTGVLPQATPKWSEGDDYLNKWRLAPIPPRN